MSSIQSGPKNLTKEFGSEEGVGRSIEREILAKVARLSPDKI